MKHLPLAPVRLGSSIGHEFQSLLGKSAEIGLVIPKPQKLQLSRFVGDRDPKQALPTAEKFLLLAKDNFPSDQCGRTILGFINGKHTASVFITNGCKEQEIKECIEALLRQKFGPLGTDSSQSGEGAVQFRDFCKVVCGWSNHLNPLANHGLTDKRKDLTRKSIDNKNVLVLEHL
jgi:hypothetical protein